MKPVVRLTLILALMALGAGTGYLLSRVLDRPPPVLAHGTAFPAPRELPAFALTDQDGRPFVPANLRGHWSILFFGFTSCADVCPTTLAALAGARRDLGDLPPVDQPSIVFVSVDPRRDSPGKLKGYVTFFDPAFRAATGTSAAIAALTGGMGVAVQVGEPDENGNYTVDHTSALFVVDPGGRLVAVLSAPHTARFIAADLRALVAAAG